MTKWRWIKALIKIWKSLTLWGRERSLSSFRNIMKALNSEVIHSDSLMKRVEIGVRGESGGSGWGVGWRSVRRAAWVQCVSVCCCVSQWVSELWRQLEIPLLSRDSEHIILHSATPPPWWGGNPRHSRRTSRPAHIPWGYCCYWLLLLLLLQILTAFTWHDSRKSNYGLSPTMIRLLKVRLELEKSDWATWITW